MIERSYGEMGKPHKVMGFLLQPQYSQELRYRNG
jgi:hypothetical protein